MDWESLCRKFVIGHYSGAAIDSREIQRGQLFFALKGARVDGCQFLADVARKGGALAVVPIDYCGNSYGLELVKVDNVLGSLHALAKRYYRELPIRSVAVTGSVGKTTTKEFIVTLLEKQFSLAKTVGNANSQATFPLSVLNRNRNSELFVMEMGMSQEGELAKLVDIAPPDLAFVGRLGMAHAQFFTDGLEGIARAKSEILSQPRTKAAILHPTTLEFLPFQKAKLKEKIVYFGSDYQLEEGPDAFRVIERGIFSPEFLLPFEASHLKENFLGAVAVARWFGMDWKEILEQIPHLRAPKMRFECFERGGVCYINDAYNSNPSSLKAALENLPKRVKGKKIGVIGEMRELGGFSEPLHRELGIKALENIDLLIAYGRETIPMVDVFLAEGRPVYHYLDISEVKEALCQSTEPGDLVLVKASQSNALWTILE